MAITTGWRVTGYVVCWLLLYGGLSYLLAGPDPGVTRNIVAHLDVAAAVVGLTALFRRYVDRRPWHDIGLIRPDRRQVAWIAGGFAAGLAVIGAWFALQLALGTATVTGYELTERGAVGMAGLLAAGLVFYLTSATVEEVAYRGYIFQNLREAMPTAGAVLLVGVLFAAPHFLAGSSGPLHLAIGTLDYVLFSTLMILARLRSGALWAAISFHAAWNWAQDYVFGTGVAGEDDYHNALVHLRLDGSPLLVGGPNNADTDVLTIVLEVLLLVGLWSWKRRRSS
ncbi:lysostaphin resistance A-like protein [Dactylosporangium sp. CS-047395]|uniref:CPBP family intramembrane glutamic endopeptidase n=1 Tax=Dactylosporangium sp. CS-047395 TaxID=3239936 RepID=UPI003D8B3E5D